MRQLVPHFILEKYLSNEHRGSLKSAGIFVDLSGFSIMTDALAKHDQLGAETLTDLMRTIFGPLVEAVYAHGGFVVGYAGDAFTAIFTEDPARAPAVMRGLAAVVAIQDHVHSHSSITTPLGTFPISIKAGLGFGEVSWLIMESGDRSQVTYCVRGSSVDASVEAEEHAGPGQTILDPSAYAELTAYVTVSPMDGFFRLEGLRADLPAPQPIPEQKTTPSILTRFYAPSVVNQPIVGEFRPVVNVFVDIPIDPTDEAFVTPFMESVFKLQKRYDGFFLRPELGDKGFNILLFWGAPTVHENNVDRALNFLLDLYTLTGISFRGGVSYRPAYAGFMGASMREDYTAYGWGVNLAARMMEASGPGEIWMEEEVARRADRHFESRLLGEFSFKGFSRKIKAFSLTGRKKATENIYRGEMVGREAELVRWRQFIEPLQRGQFAGVLVLKGEAGIGKSRLAYEFQHAAEGEAAQWVICQTDEILRQSLNPFEAWLKASFHFSDDQPDEVNWQSFDQQLQALIESTPDADLTAELTRTRSVLAAQLNLSEPGSFYDQLDAKGRYENTFIALSVLLHAQSLQKPLVLFIEDLHWLDEDTRAFLPYLVRNTLADPEKHYPLAILASTRPEGAFPDLNDPALLQEIRLQRLPAEGLSRLAEGILEGHASPSLTSLLERRSEGNPFFAEQILRYLIEKGLLLRLADGTFSSVPRAEMLIPTDVNAVLIARLDSLTREVREVVQTASILGREFELRLLAEMLRGETSFDVKIKSAEHSDIWIALNELAYIFRHALLWDAAYSMQLEARRRKLHALALETMERVHANDLDEYYGELAYHSEKAFINEKALYYLKLAGKVAADAYQNAEAVDYFSRALNFVPSGDLQIQFDLLLQSVELFGRLGNRVRQLEDLERLETLAAQMQNNAQIARVRMMRSAYQFVTGNYPGANEFAEQAITLAQSVDLAEVALDAYNVWSISLMRQADLKSAMQKANEGLALMKTLNMRLQQGIILNSIGMIAIEEKNPIVAQDSLEQALSIAREYHSRDLETKVVNNLANAAGFLRGDYSAARDYYDQLCAITRERGDRYGEGLVLSNLAWVAGIQGDFAASRIYHKQALAISREVGNLYQEAYTLINLSAVAGIQGDSDIAIQSARQAYELTRRIGDRSGESWSLLNMGHAYLLMGKFERAWDTYQQCVDLREQLGRAGFSVEPMAGLVQAALQMDNLSAALTVTESILAYLADGGTLDGAEEPLRIYHACYVTLKKAQDLRAKTVLQAAAQLLNTQALTFRDEISRRRYIESAPWRLAIQLACASDQ